MAAFLTSNALSVRRVTAAMAAGVTTCVLWAQPGGDPATPDEAFVREASNKRLLTSRSGEWTWGITRLDDLNSSSLLDASAKYEVSRGGTVSAATTLPLVLYRGAVCNDGALLGYTYDTNISGRTIFEAAGSRKSSLVLVRLDTNGQSVWRRDFGRTVVYGPNPPLPAVPFVNGFAVDCSTRGMCLYVTTKRSPEEVEVWQLDAGTGETRDVVALTRPKTSERTNETLEEVGHLDDVGIDVLRFYVLVRREPSKAAVWACRLVLVDRKKPRDVVWEHEWEDLHNNAGLGGEVESMLDAGVQMKTSDGCIEIVNRFGVSHRVQVEVADDGIGYTVTAE